MTTVVDPPLTSPEGRNVATNATSGGTMTCADVLTCEDPEFMRDLRDASAPGRCDEAVAYLIRRWGVTGPAPVVDLREYGAWDDLGDDEAADVARWVWVTACLRRELGDLDHDRIAALATLVSP